MRCLKFLLLFLALIAPLEAQTPASPESQQIAQLKARVAFLEDEINDGPDLTIGALKFTAGAGGGSALVLLFGAICALWAQNTKRNAWLWFFCGLLFNIFTVFVLLAKNSNDLQRAALRTLIDTGSTGSPGPAKRGIG